MLVCLVDVSMVHSVERRLALQAGVVGEVVVPIPLEVRAAHLGVRPNP